MCCNQRNRLHSWGNDFSFFFVISLFKINVLEIQVELWLSHYNPRSQEIPYFHLSSKNKDIETCDHFSKEENKKRMQCSKECRSLIRAYAYTIRQIKKKIERFGI